MNFKKLTLFGGNPCYIKKDDVVFFSTHPQAVEDECLIKLRGGHEIIVDENLQKLEEIFTPKTHESETSDLSGLNY